MADDEYEGDVMPSRREQLNEVFSDLQNELKEYVAPALGTRLLSFLNSAEARVDEIVFGPPVEGPGDVVVERVLDSQDYAPWFRVGQTTRLDIQLRMLQANTPVGNVVVVHQQHFPKRLSAEGRILRLLKCKRGRWIKNCKLETIMEAFQMIATTKRTPPGAAEDLASRSEAATDRPVDLLAKLRARTASN